MECTTVRPHTVLHLGAHKTGTTLLQYWLARNRSLLATEGVGISVPSDLDDSKFDRLCFELSKPRQRTVSRDDVIDYLTNLRNYLGSPPTHVISKENILGEAGRIYVNSRPVLNELSHIFQDHKIDIVFYVRRQDDFVESHILQQYAHGIEVSVADAVASISTNNWISVIGGMEEYFKDRVHVKFFENIHYGVFSFIEDFCKSCRIPIDIVGSSIFPGVENQNRSISSNGLKILKSTWGGLNKTERITEFNRVRRIHHTGIEPKPAILNDIQRREILNRYREENKYLIEKYGDSNEELMAKYCV